MPEVLDALRQGAETSEVIRPKSAGQAKQSSMDFVDLDQSHHEAAASTVRLRYKGVRVRESKFRQQRKVRDDHKARAANAVGAEAKRVSMSKLLWDRDDEPVKALRKVYNEISHLFKDRFYTIPTPHEGLRLMRRDKLADFNARMQDLSRRLHSQAEIFKLAMPALIRQMQLEQGETFDAADYNFDPVAECHVEWWFPEVMEDRELAEIDQGIYQQEVQRIRDQLQQCVQLAETNLTEQLYIALQQASTKLESDATGKRKRFNASTVTKLFEELDYVQMQLSENKIGGSAVSAVVTKLKDLLSGEGKEYLPDSLRASDTYRERFGAKCGEIATQLLTTAVPAARRKLLRNQAFKAEEKKESVLQTGG